MKMMIGVLAALALALTACAPSAPPQEDAPDRPGTVPSVREAQSPQPSGSREGQLPGLPDGIMRLYQDIQPLDPSHNYQEGLPHPMVTQRPALCGLAEEFLADPWAFRERYDEQAQFGLGVGRQVEVQGWLRYLEMLHIQKPQPLPVIGGYQLGETMDKLTGEFGPPHFTEPELHLSGYRFPDFYLVVQGKEVSEQVTFLRMPQPPPGRQRILDRFRGQAGEESFQSSFPHMLLEEYPGCFYENLYDGFGGWLAYDSGVVFLGNSYRLVEVWGNYEGDIYFDKPGYEYRFHPEDFFFTQVCNYYRRWQDYLTREGADSPNGKYTALANNAGRPVNGDWISLRCNDGSGPDLFIGTPHSQSQVFWASDRYLLFNVWLYAPRLYDLQTGETRLIHELAGLTGDHLAQGYRREEGESFMYRMKDGRLLWYDEFDNQFLLAYDFDSAGNIIFTSEPVTAEKRDRLLEDLR